MKAFEPLEERKPDRFGKVLGWTCICLLSIVAIRLLVQWGWGI